MDVNELLKTSLMKNAKLLAGSNGISQSINWCVPDTGLEFENWVMPGLLCIYTNKMKKYSWKQYSDLLLKHSPAGIILFNMTEESARELFDFDFFDKHYLPLILMPNSKNVLSFTKQMTSLLSKSFNVERRTEEWLRDLCCGYKDASNEALGELLGYSHECSYYCLIARLCKVTVSNPLSTEYALIHAKNELQRVFQIQNNSDIPCLAYIEQPALVMFVPFINTKRDRKYHPFPESP